MICYPASGSPANYPAGGPAWISHQEVIIHRYQMICELAGGSPDDLLS
jgi:hypothetical protein